MKFSHEPTPEQLAELSLGAKYLSLQAPITEDIQKMIRQAENRVFQAISDGSLTPEMALQGWYEVNSYHRLLQKFNQRIKMGQSQGETLLGEANG